MIPGLFRERHRPRQGERRCTAPAVDNITYTLTYKERLPRPRRPASSSTSRRLRARPTSPMTAPQAWPGRATNPGAVGAGADDRAPSLPPSPPRQRPPAASPITVNVTLAAPASLITAGNYSIHSTAGDAPQREQDHTPRSAVARLPVPGRRLVHRPRHHNACDPTLANGTPIPSDPQADTATTLNGTMHGGGGRARLHERRLRRDRQRVRLQERRRALHRGQRAHVDTASRPCATRPTASTRLPERRRALHHRERAHSLPLLRVQQQRPLRRCRQLQRRSRLHGRRLVLRERAHAPARRAGRSRPTRRTQAGLARSTAPCTNAAAALVCVSGVCDTADGKCGYLSNGDGPCTVAGQGAVCRSGAVRPHGRQLRVPRRRRSLHARHRRRVVCRSGTCSVGDLVCEPAGGCEVDADCSAGQWCNWTPAQTCTPKVAKRAARARTTRRTPTRRSTARAPSQGRRRWPA